MRKNAEEELKDLHSQYITQKEKTWHREEVVEGDDMIGLEGASVVEADDLREDKDSMSQI